MTSTTETTPASSPAPRGPTTAQVARAVAALTRESGRDDVATPLEAAATRCDRPTTIVCVVGEFKQGKSSLVNALVGLDLCPVDDDLATSALTLVHFGAELTVTVRRGEEGGAVADRVDPDALRDWVTEAGNPGNSRRVERVDITAPSPVLAEGLALVDSPGAGGLAGGYAAATLAFLPYADALIFVSDASAELSAPEIEFLAAARERCPVVIHALTKTDLYPSWRRMAAIDEDHLGRAGIDARTMPLSAPLRQIGLERLDGELGRRSGYPALLTLLRNDVVRPARANAARRAAAETEAALSLLEAAAREELAVLADPSRAAGVVARAEAANVRLDHLRGPGARWSTLVADRMSELSNDATFRFRGAMRDVLREMDEATESLKTPKDWEALSDRLQERVATAVGETFAGLDRGADAIRESVLELLAEESIDLPASSTGREVDVRALWRGQSIGLGGSKVGRVAGTAMTALRGSQGGMLTLALLSRFAPAGVAAVMMSNPVTLGLGAAFAGVQLLDAHRRRLGALRQQAKTHIRQFLDDVQFEIGNQVGQSIRETQRGLRDEFAAAIDRLSRSYADAATQAQQAAQVDAARAAERAAALEKQLARIEQARRLLAQSVS